MNRMASPDRLEFPFATESVTNRLGQIAKVVLSLQKYRALIEAVEEAGLYRAMKREFSGPLVAMWFEVRLPELENGLE